MLGQGDDGVAEEPGEKIIITCLSPARFYPSEAINSPDTFFFHLKRKVAICMES